MHSIRRMHVRPRETWKIMANRAPDWLAQSKHDLSHARNALDDGDYDWACFATHQAAEKAVRVFTTLSSSRFLDREAAVEELRRCAERVAAAHDAVIAVYLFGSFATGTATPRSDADVAIEIADEDVGEREAVRDEAMRVFLDAPVPVDLFVLPTTQFASKRGVAGAVRREHVLLAGRRPRRRERS